jgi:hypothetical protein
MESVMDVRYETTHTIVAGAAKSLRDRGRANADVPPLMDENVRDEAPP